MPKPQSPLENIDVDVTRLPAKGRWIKFVATDDELKAISRHFDLVSLENMKADLLVVPWRRVGVEVSGRISATYSQSCVLSFEIIQQNLSEDVTLSYVPEGSPLAKPELDSSGEMVIDPESEDLPEEFSGSTIDISQSILECLTLAIDPFPRLPDVRMPDKYAPDPDIDDQPKSPFAVLAQLKSGKT